MSTQSRPTVFRFWLLPVMGGMLAGIGFQLQMVLSGADSVWIKLAGAIDNGVYPSAGRLLAMHGGTACSVVIPAAITALSVVAVREIATHAACYLGIVFAASVLIPPTASILPSAWWFYTVSGIYCISRAIARRGCEIGISFA